MILSNSNIKLIINYKFYKINIFDLLKIKYEIIKYYLLVIIYRINVFTFDFYYCYKNNLKKIRLINH